MKAVERVCAFLDEAQVYYLATAEGDQPRVRPFGAVSEINGSAYICTNNTKPVYRQLDKGIQERKLNFKTELDVRGQRLQDALDIVTHYIDDAIMLNMSSVRIIHGKGTGVLRDEIQKYLRTVPGVASAKDESIQLGGTGVTVVTFD